MDLVMIQKKNCLEIYTIHKKGVNKCIETYVNTYNAINDIFNLQEK